MDPGLVLVSLRHHRTDPKLEPVDLLELVPPSFPHWCLRVCSLFGPIPMVGNELKPPCLLCYLMTLISLSFPR